MDDFNCRYSFFTTYNRTWFLQRRDDDSFRYAGPVLASTDSSAETVPVRECLLYLAFLTKDHDDAFYQGRADLKLVCSFEGLLLIMGFAKRCVKTRSTRKRAATAPTR